jgi:excisionase family DNA binding protein
MSNRWLTAEEVADCLGVSERFVRRLIAERRIAFSRLPGAGARARAVRIAEADLAAYAEAGRVEPLTPGEVWRTVRGVA